MNFWPGHILRSDLLKYLAETLPDGVVFMRAWGVPVKYLPVARHASRVSHFAVPRGLNADREAWHNSQNVVLPGDAVHPMPHFFG